MRRTGGRIAARARAACSKRVAPPSSSHPLLAVSPHASYRIVAPSFHAVPSAASITTTTLGSPPPPSSSSLSSSPSSSSLTEPPTTHGDDRRLYPLPHKRCSVASLPLDVQHSDRFLVSRRGQALYQQTFRPPFSSKKTLKGVVFLVHDYGDHSSWFLRDLAVALCQRGFGVVSLDLEGHGRSDGLRGQLHVPNAIVDLCDHFGALSLEYQATPCFLLGEGLGAALAYKTYLMQGGRFWDGLIMLSPTLAFPPRLRPPGWVISLLRRFEHRLGDVPLVPWGQLYLDLLSDSVTRQDVLENPYFIKQHGMRVSTVLHVLSALDELYLPGPNPSSLGPSPPSSPPPSVCTFEELTAPFLILQGEEDRFHGGREGGREGGRVAQELYERAKSLDKSMRIYPGISHCLLGEGGGEGGREGGVERVCGDIVEWLNARCASGEGGGEGGSGGGGGGAGGGVEGGRVVEEEEDDDLELVHRP